MSEVSNTESKILDAAKKVFIKKGLEGTRMQEIADEAGINKALLHYYYRSKEKLFSAVFKFALSKLIPRIEGILTSDEPVEEKIIRLVDQYIGLLQKNQFIPIFIFHEISRNPERIIEAMKSSGLKPDVFIDQVQKEIDSGRICISSPHQLIINIIALCVFPFVARPMMQGIFFNNDKKSYNDFIEGRKKEVADFILSAIRTKEK